MTRKTELVSYRASKRRRTNNWKTRSETGGRSRSTSSYNTWGYANPRSYLVAWDPFPARARARLRYSTTIDLQPQAAGVPGAYIFRANSIFDPDSSGVGHQPYGHDTYQSIYNHYRVVESSIILSPINNSSGTLGITITDDTTVNGNYDTIKEVKGTKMITILNNARAGSVKQTFQHRQFLANQNTSAQFGGNPTEQAYFHCWYCSTPTGTPTMQVVVAIEYLVDMWELKDLGQS